MPLASTQTDRKTRGDSDLNARLSEAEQEAFFAVIERTTLKEAASWLLVHHEIILSTTAIGKWAEKMRRKGDDFRFQRLLRELRHDNEQATIMAGEIGSAAQLNDANVLLLSQALFSARRTGDPAELKAAAKLFAMVMESVAKAKAAEAAVIAASTSRDKFQFDAAKSALEHIDTLQSIKASSGDDREKVERAVVAVFGRRPGTFAPSNSGGGDGVGGGSSVDQVADLGPTSGVRKGSDN